MYIVYRKPTGYEHTQAGRDMIIYPDSCIYGRQQDDQTQQSIQDETVAIINIFLLCRVVGYTIAACYLVEKEILANRDPKGQKAAHNLFKEVVTLDIDLTTADFKRAAEFKAQGLRNKDSIHLAAAEAAEAAYLITVDKDFVRIAADKKLSNVKVINPLNFKWR